MDQLKELTYHSSSRAKDKMILEEAYSRNPKPDKQARLEIVERVSLNEKEVQVWAEIELIDDAFLSVRPWVALCLTGFVCFCVDLVPKPSTK